MFWEDYIIYLTCGIFGKERKRIIAKERTKLRSKLRCLGNNYATRRIMWQKAVLKNINKIKSTEFLERLESVMPQDVYKFIEEFVKEQGNKLETEAFNSIVVRDLTSVFKVLETAVNCLSDWQKHYWQAVLKKYKRKKGVYIVHRPPEQRRVSGI